MKTVTTNISFPTLEQEVLAYWEENKIFERSMEPDTPVSPNGEKSPRKSYVFYDGPPFATGLPHYGHLLAGTIKDVVGRFFTMKGYHVDRRFGWDCHGVPVEFEIQKTLDLHGAKAIRDFGVGAFNEECRKIVLRYTKEWEEFVKRSGRWVDFSRQYRTMDKDFMESIWWVVKRLWDRGLIYEGQKCVPYSWAMNTPLSNFEANLNYKTVQDPAVTVKGRILTDINKHLNLSQKIDLPVVAYAWTTTPWTLPSNMAFAVGPEIKYSLVRNEAENEVAIIASDLVERHISDFNKEESESLLIAEVNGSDLVGLEYEPFFPYFEEERANSAFRIYSEDFVTAEEGTGIVHCASFGEDDLKLFLKHGIKVVDPVDEDGNFTGLVPDFQGVNVKKADSEIIAHLKKSGKMVSHVTIEHSYPFCWRTDTPLIYKSISSWFVKVETIQDVLIQNNSTIHWVPEHIRDGRFGKWLENSRDWAISRNRFWGTPIPLWRCESCEEIVCIGSVSELEEKSGEKVDDLHSHYIDGLKVKCSSCGSEAKRVPQVLDCWFESGSMPYAQAHYPFENKQEFEDTFPADFIAEGLDQTRGWFYTLLVLSTALFGEAPFKNVVVNGIVLAEDGKKMSKSLKNYPPPDDVMNEFGSDAMRLYLLASAATRGEDLRFSKEGVQQVVRQTLLPLWNAYNFLVTYALADDWSHTDIPEEPSNNLLDRWLVSKVSSLIDGVDTALSNYHLYAAAPPILEFVDQLTNWYIRLNRRRFWAGNSEEEKRDKAHAYATLHQALLSFVRVLAPLAPFISEDIFRNLSRGISNLEFDSVHLAPFPSTEEFGKSSIDKNLELSMELFEEVILLGRSLRNEHGHKVRQPLAKLTVIHPRAEELERVKVLDSYIRDELNVKTVDYSSDEAGFVLLSARLNTKKLGKTLGPKLGSGGMKKLRQAVEKLPSDKIQAIENGDTLSIEGVELGKKDILIERKAKVSGDASASSGQVTIVLDTALTQELRLEGLAREFVNRVQKLRKDLNFEVTDRIIISFMTACPRLTVALEENSSYVQEETLAVELIQTKDESAFDLGKGEAQEIDGKTVIISLSRIQA